ncbi:serine/threonine-protein kinase SMG1-like [Plutella xylostella]|uniref:serine/threonine-protein kinase SMG1-like n=1 Tax=Plutella xylostella TaxID=51655 RepID=UPI002032DFF5|nr:serine/threonine-protein kinase SMG1-like [Plutella xylostella]
MTVSRDQILAILPEIEKSALKWLEENEAITSLETRLRECHQQMALVKELEAYGASLHQHPLHGISQQYSTYKQAKNAVEDSMKALVKILKDFDTQIEAYVAAHEVLNGPQLMEWIQEFSGANEPEPTSIFEHIKDFLTNAGQSTMITQCEQAETELNQCMQQTAALLRNCLDLLSQYVAVAQYYPQSRTEYYRIVMFRKWLAAALDSRSPDVCREVAAQVAALVNADNNNSNSNTAQQIVAYNYRLQAVCAEANANLNKAYERMHQEASPEAIAVAQEAYRDAKANISNWVRTEEHAASALECVVIGMICNLNRRYLMLENGAQSAGDCLVDLTSRDGEWFLDDMLALSNQAVELLSLLPLQSASAEDAAMPAAVECVRNVNLLLADLVQLNYNFSTIILPETLKKVHSEDPSTLQMMSELNAVIVNTPVPLNELLQQLEMRMRYLVMDMESPADTSQQIVADLRARYEALLSPTPPESDSQSAGRMLLMGFNGLFAAIELRARELADYLAAPIPAVWRKIDHISDALHMSAALHSPALRSVLEDMFVTRRIQVVAEVLSMAAQMAASFKGKGPVVVYDDAQMCKPVKRFTACYVSRSLLGAGPRALAAVPCVLLRRAPLDLAAEVGREEIGASWSVSLESLCEKARLAYPHPRLLDRAASLAGAVVAGAGGAGAGARGAGAGARRAPAAAAAAMCVRARVKAHLQLHSQVLGGGPDLITQCVRASRELLAAAHRLTAAKARALSLVTAAHQRVKWGAGANPALKSTVEALEVSWLSARSAATALAGAARGAGAAGGALPVKYKHARTATQALAHWEKACTLAQKYALNVSAVEESLMEMLHPEGSIDAHWVSNVSCLLRDMISSLTSSLASAQTSRASLAAPPVELAAARAARANVLKDCSGHVVVLAGEVSVVICV